MNHNWFICRIVIGGDSLVNTAYNSTSSLSETKWASASRASYQFALSLFRTLLQEPSTALARDSQEQDTDRASL